MKIILLFYRYYNNKICLDCEATRNQKYTKYIWRKIGPGPWGPPPANFTTHLHGKNMNQVMMSCPSQWTEISACACSAWRDLTQLGELTCLKPITWEKVGLPPRVTLSRQPSDTTPWTRFALSRVKCRQLFISNCRKTWLAPVGSGGRVPARVPWLTFLHISRA